MPSCPELKKVSRIELTRLYAVPIFSGMYASCLAVNSTFAPGGRCRPTRDIFVGSASGIALYPGYWPSHRRKSVLLTHGIEVGTEGSNEVVVKASARSRSG